MLYASRLFSWHFLPLLCISFDMKSCHCLELFDWKRNSACLLNKNNATLKTSRKSMSFGFVNPKPCQAENGISNFFFYSFSFSLKFSFPLRRFFYLGGTFRVPIDLPLQRLNGSVNKFICSQLRHLIKYSRRLKNKNMTRQIRYYFKWIFLKHSKKNEANTFNTWCAFSKLILSIWLSMSDDAFMLQGLFNPHTQAQMQFQTNLSIIESGSNLIDAASSHVLSLCAESNIKTVIK